MQRPLKSFIPAEMAEPQSAPNTKLAVRDICKRYNEIFALEPSSLTVKEGEFLTLLGPSGSGKTTLLMMIAGLVEPTSGEIWIDGRLATEVPSHARDIGMVFQNYALFPHMTVAENIAFPLETRGWNKSRREESVRRALAQVKLDRFSDRLPTNLSGGQQQRVALARALVYEPSIVLMDEPLGALDKKLREHMQFEIRNLHRDLGITVVYVTHDQDEAMSLSDRICLMNNARIEQIDTPVQLYEKPRSIFAANFLGESNLIPVDIQTLTSDLTICVAANGTVLRAAGVATHLGGATLMVRPERCRITSESAQLENGVPGTIRDVIMLGALTRFIVETEIGLIVVIGLSGPDSRQHIAGDKIFVSWSVESSSCVAAAGTS